MHLRELCTCLCGRRESQFTFFFWQPHLASGLLLWRGREESAGTTKPNVVEKKVTCDKEA